MTGQSFMLKAMLFAVALVGLGLVKMPQATAAEKEMIYCIVEPPQDKTDTIVFGNNRSLKIPVKNPGAFIAFRFPTKKVKQWAPTKEKACLTDTLTPAFIRKELGEKYYQALEFTITINIDRKAYNLPYRGVSFNFIENEVAYDRSVLTDQCGKPGSEPDKNGFRRFPIKGSCTRNSRYFYGFPAEQDGRSALVVTTVSCQTQQGYKQGRCIMRLMYRGWEGILDFPGQLLPQWRDLTGKVLSQLNNHLVVSMSPLGCKGKLCERLKIDGGPRNEHNGN